MQICPGIRCKSSLPVFICNSRTSVHLCLQGHWGVQSGVVWCEWMMSVWHAEGSECCTAAVHNLFCATDRFNVWQYFQEPSTVFSKHDKKSKCAVCMCMCMWCLAISSFLSIPSVLIDANVWQIKLAKMKSESWRPFPTEDVIYF